MFPFLASKPCTVPFLLSALYSAVQCEPAERWKRGKEKAKEEGKHTVGEVRETKPAAASLT